LNFGFASEKAGNWTKSEIENPPAETPHDSVPLPNLQAKPLFAENFQHFSQTAKSRQLDPF
jgi:hypothetical protein